MDNDKIIIGTIKDKDGIERDLNAAEFIEMLKNPDTAQITLLRAIIKSILDHYQEDPASVTDETLRKNIELLRLFYEHAEKEGEAAGDPGRLEEFFRGDLAFIATPRPRGIENLLSISRTGSVEILQKNTNNMRITVHGRLSFDEQKIGEMFRIAFISQNPYKAKTGLRKEVIIPLGRTMELLGRIVNAENKKKFSQLLNREILPNISHTYFELKQYGEKWHRIEIGGGSFGVNIKQDEIFFTLSDDYAYYLNSGALSQFNSKALELGTRQRPQAFYLYQKLSDHYFHDGNRARGTNNLLSVQALLKFCEDVIPSYDYIKQTDRGRWTKRIREPLEDALNEIQDKGLFKWQYCMEQLREPTEKELNPATYADWSKLYITFQLIPEEPAQDERLEHKRKRIEAAQERRKIENAEKKTDKIRRRKKKKTDDKAE